MTAEFPFSEFSDPLLIARGSMGEVWRAKDERTGDLRAVKTLSDDMLDNKWIVKCLRQEFELAKKFNHKNLVSAYRWIEESSRPGFVMDYIDGIEFKVLLHEKKLDFADRFAIVRGVTDALHYLHTADIANWIIHCDIKPENVLVFKEKNKRIARNNAILVDYGTAMIVPNRPRFINTGRIKEFFTRQRVVGGSYLYMSPEQTEAEELDPRSDIYSMGCFMYEVFTGRPPFISQLDYVRDESTGLDDSTLDREELAVMHREQEAEDPRKYNSRLQSDLAAVIMRCLQKDPMRRFQTVYALASELGKIQVFRGQDEIFDDGDTVTHLRTGMLVGIRGSFKGLRKPIAEKKVMIGRHAEESCDLIIPAEDRHVSGRHCQIFRQGDTFALEDLDSRNGTFVNGRKVKRQVLQVGDKIQFGKHVFRFEYD